MPKTSSIRSAVTTEHRLVTDIIVIIIIMFVYWRLSNATNTEQWHNTIA